VLDGELAHKDSLGTGSVIRPGDVQRMSAGRGVMHSEFNPSREKPVHFLQIWIQPSRLNHQPAYAQRDAVAADARGWNLLASPDGRDDSLPIRQDAWLRSVRLDASETAAHVLDPSRLYWLHVARGTVLANGRALHAGDALGFRDESGPLRLNGHGEHRADVLLFDLPP